MSRARGVYDPGLIRPLPPEDQELLRKAKQESGLPLLHKDEQIIGEEGNYFVVEGPGGQRLVPKSSSEQTTPPTPAAPSSTPVENTQK